MTISSPTAADIPACPSAPTPIACDAVTRRG
nr:MAG TPA: hypothetical protein [Bacteriophage sp.]